MKFVVKNEKVKERAIMALQGLKLDPVHEVIIRPYKKNRSIQQNSYYWKIISVIANELGYNKDELHEEMKERFLVKIFTRDDEGFAEMIDAIWQVNEDSRYLSSILSREVVKLTSTTQANTKQMAEYIDDVKHFAYGLGIKLPAPEYDE